MIRLLGSARRQPQYTVQPFCDLYQYLFIYFCSIFFIYKTIRFSSYNWFKEMYGKEKKRKLQFALDRISIDMEKNKIEGVLTFYPKLLKNQSLKTVTTTGPEGIRPHREPSRSLWQVAISLTQLSFNIRKRGSWGTNRHRLGKFSI